MRPEYDQTVKIRPDGKINLGIIGAVDAAGKSAEELQTELRDRYHAQGDPTRTANT